jgi:hypothetical protein
MMIATPQLTEPPAPDLIGRPERNGGGDRGRQSALALHCMPLDARPLHEPPRRLTKISKKKLSSRFPVTFLLKSMCRGPRRVRQFAEMASSAGCVRSVFVHSSFLFDNNVKSALLSSLLCFKACLCWWLAIMLTTFRDSTNVCLSNLYCHFAYLQLSDISTAGHHHMI